MDNLPGDIFSKILLLLPVKSILCSKLVCKTWRSHISNPEFVKQHVAITTNNPNNDLFIVHDSGHKLSVIDVNFLDRAVNLKLPVRGISSRVIASCNGLLCIVCFVKKYQEVVYLWNPVTKQVKEIHRYTYYTNTVGENDVNYTSTAFGFGFDHATGDYKAVKIKQGNQNAKGFTSRVDVYSLNENCWKEIKVDFWIGYIQPRPDIPTVNGSHYWLARHGYSAPVLSFNMQSQKFSTIQLPDVDDLSHLWDPELHEVYSHPQEVATVCQFKDSVAIRYKSDVYVLDNGSGWSKKLSIKGLSSSVECLKTGEFIGCRYHCNQRGFYSHDQVFLYDSVKDVFKPIVQLKSYCKGLFHYTESLFDLN